MKRLIFIAARIAALSGQSQTKMIDSFAIQLANQKQDFTQSVADTALEKQVQADKPEVPEVNPVIERKIIKEGEISFETTNSTETRKVISKSIADFKGYISNDNIDDYKDRIEHKIIIRVPAEQFDSLLDKISQSAKKLDSKNINALDVTEEFIDVETRIKTKKELENRYKELLKKANTVEEILTIEKEIGNLRTDIESIEGRLTYLKNKISFSTLTVVFYEKTSSTFGFSSKLGHAIQNGWTNLLWFFVGLANLWPFVVIGGIVVFMYRRYKNRNKKQNVK